MLKEDAKQSQQGLGELREGLWPAESQGQEREVWGAHFTPRSDVPHPSLDSKLVSLTGPILGICDESEKEQPLRMCRMQLKGKSE